MLWISKRFFQALSQIITHSMVTHSMAKIQKSWEKDVRTGSDEGLEADGFSGILVNCMKTFRGQSNRFYDKDNLKVHLVLSKLYHGSSTNTKYRKEKEAKIKNCEERLSSLFEEIEIFVKKKLVRRNNIQGEIVYWFLEWMNAVMQQQMNKQVIDMFKDEMDIEIFSDDIDKSIHKSI